MPYIISLRHIVCQTGDPDERLEHGWDNEGILTFLLDSFQTPFGNCPLLALNPQFNFYACPNS